MSDSILTSIKKQLGLEEAYTHFDADIIININSAIATLTGIGVGPSNGFIIEDKTQTWDDFVPRDIRNESIQTYIYLKVKLIFDPPMSTAVMETYKETIREIEWRLST